MKAKVKKTLNVLTDSFPYCYLTFGPIYSSKDRKKNINKVPHKCIKPFCNSG